MERFTVVVGGRRLGKSFLAAYLALKELFIPRHKVWIIAPNHDLAGRIWQYLDIWMRDHFQDVFTVNRHEHIIENKINGAKLWTKSAESPQSFRGEGLDLVIFDEAALVPQEVWEGNIRPNLMDSEGRAFFISNPFGFNWFYKIYRLGDPTNPDRDPEWISFRIPTALEDESGNLVGSNNPRIALKELEAAKRVTPPDVWKQEYLSTFQEGAGQRFKDWEKCVDRSIVVDDQMNWSEEPIPGHLYYMGVDIARAEDFTVVSVVDRMTHRLTAFVRINEVSWEYIRQKIKDISDKYNFAEIVSDATANGGDMFAEDIERMGANLDTRFVFTNKTKIMLIDKLGIMMERGKISFPPIPVLMEEIKAFTYHQSRAGNLIYGSSAHDDTVISLALACWHLLDDPLGDSVDNSVWLPKKRTFV